MSLPLTCHPTTPFSEAKSIELGLKGGRSLRLAHGNWGRGTQKAKNGKNSPCFISRFRSGNPPALKASARGCFFPSEQTWGPSMRLPQAGTRAVLGYSGQDGSPGGAGRRGRHLRGAPWNEWTPETTLGACHTQRAEMAAEGGGEGGEEAHVSVAGACGGACVYSLMLVPGRPFKVRLTQTFSVSASVFPLGPLVSPLPAPQLFQRPLRAKLPLPPARGLPPPRGPPPPPHPQPASSTLPGFVLPEGGACPRIRLQQEVLRTSNIPYWGPSVASDLCEIICSFK